MLGAGFSVLVIVALVANDMVRKTAEAVGWVDRTHEVIESIDSVVEGLVHAEAARHGLGLNGEIDEEVRFAAADGQLTCLLERLAALTAYDSSQEFFGRLHKLDEEGSELIEDLLRLSKSSRGELRLEDIDIAVLARECAADLTRLEPERVIELRIASPIPARGDKRLVKAMLENLTENALKFSSMTGHATIDVRDKGAGFDMRYADKLFGAFQRLHDENDFPRTGIGLATAQRIL